MENGIQLHWSNAPSSVTTDNSTNDDSSNDLLPAIFTTDQIIPGRKKLTSVESESASIPTHDSCESHASDSADVHETIMSACSTVGQHIRQNITKTLNSRVTEVPSAATDDVSSSFLPSVIEKLENFESSLIEKLSGTVNPAFHKEPLPDEINGEDMSLLSVDGSCVEQANVAKLNRSIERSEDNCSKTLPSSSCGDDSTPVSSSKITEINSCPENDGQDASREFVAKGTDFNDSDKCDTRISDINSSQIAIKTACSSFGQQICQTITETLNSNVDTIVGTDTDSAVSSNLVSMVEAAIMDKFHNFENTLLEKLDTILSGVIDTASLQNENEETSSLSGEADIAEKDSVEDINSEKWCASSVQNGASSDNKVSATSDNAALKEKAKKSPRNATNKKKGEKTIGFFTNQILKSLSGCTSNEEKLNVLCRKHAETLDKQKSTEIRLKQNERQVVQLSREKEQLQAEHNRNVLAKSRLESLCRELQRQNKAVKEESLLRIREEEEKRKEVASKFQTTLNEISTLMQENSKKNLQLKEENGELAQKLKTLVEHYEMWEKHMEKVVQQKDLEAQLAKAKHAKTNLQLKQETESFLREKQALLENMSELQKKCTQLAANELQLRSELSDYTSKYEEFQTVLNKSNQVFATFKTDMDTTSKKIKKLEKETNIWKQKWESSNNALIEMITDKQVRDKELKNAQQRVLTLEKLCRALQAERNDLQNQVKGKLVEDNCNAPCEEGTQAC